MNRLLHREIAVLAGTLLAVLGTLFFSFAGDCEQVQEQVLRLHILANSDSQEDQSLKIRVRDAVLAAAAELFQHTDSREDAEASVQDNLRFIAQTAQQEIYRQGYDYPVTEKLLRTRFDTRVYEDFTLPAGEYDALQLLIGNGQGKNWWCVMFPPLCIPAAVEEEEADWFREQGLCVLEKTASYEPRFAAVELWQKMSAFFRENR